MTSDKLYQFRFYSGNFVVKTVNNNQNFRPRKLSYQEQLSVRPRLHGCRR